MEKIREFYLNGDAEIKEDFKDAKGGFKELVENLDSIKKEEEKLPSGKKPE